jgi:septal ring factor EnvC (AmiA/AmiB activator)
MSMPESGRQVMAAWYVSAAAVAAGLNLVIILVICFVLMPRVDSAVAGSAKNSEAIRKNQEAAEKTHRLLAENWGELEEHRRVIKKLSDLINQAEARAKAIEAARKAKDKPPPGK